AGTRIHSGLELERALLDRPAGEHVPVLVQRKGTEQHLELVLQAGDRLLAAPTELIWRKLGLKLAPVTGELVSRTSQQLHGGLAVVEVNPDGPAGRGG